LQLVLDVTTIGTPELAEAWLLPQVRAMDAEQAEKEWREVEGTWTGDM
jgi:hypothetical protein